MKLNKKILICGIILISIFSCKKEIEEFNTEYLLGEWSFYHATELKNDVEKENPKLSKPIRYMFKSNGTVLFGNNNAGKTNWKILKENIIEIGSEDVYFEHEVEIESHSEMKLHLTFENKLITYYYKRGWSE